MRKSEFENVIDGQTIVSGIALIFTKEFNEFHQLWNSILRAQKDKEESEKKEGIIPPFWDGKAAVRIAKILVDNLDDSISKKELNLSISNV